MKQKGVFKVRMVPNIVTRDMILAFVPDDRRARDILSGLDVDKKVLAWVHTARYPEHHRFAFAVMQKIADAVGTPVEAVLLWLKLETFRFDYVRMPDGSTEKSPHSIAFESMSQEEFQSFWNDVLPVLAEKVLPNIDQQTYDEIVSMISGKVD